MDDVYCYGKTTTSGTDEITVTTSFNFSGAVIAIEIQGLASFALDGTPTTLAIASSNSWTLASLITTNANDIIIGCGGNESTNNTYTAGSGYAIPANGQVSGSNQSGFCETQVVSSSGTYAPTAALAGAMAGQGLTYAFK